MLIILRKGAVRRVFRALACSPFNLFLIRSECAAFGTVAVPSASSLCALRSGTARRRWQLAAVTEGSRGTQFPGSWHVCARPTLSSRHLSFSHMIAIVVNVIQRALC